AGRGGLQATTGGDVVGRDDLVDHTVERPHGDLRAGCGVVGEDADHDEGRGTRGRDRAGGGHGGEGAAGDRSGRGRGPRLRAGGEDRRVVGHGSARLTRVGGAEQRRVFGIGL